MGNLQQPAEAERRGGIYLGIIVINKMLLYSQIGIYF
jgi:hypothetical protein